MNKTTGQASAEVQPSAPILGAYVLVDPLADVEDSFFPMREALELRTAGKEEFDFNGLSPTAKQAALSLKNEAKVSIREKSGRMVVMGASPSLFAKLLALA
jgi:hypothetical protein